MKQTKTSEPKESPKRDYALARPEPIPVLALQDWGALDGLNLQRRNLPRLVKAQDRLGVNIQVGGIVAGIVVDVLRSPKPEVKASLLWLHITKLDNGKPIATGIEITFPCTGVIREALAPGFKGREDEARTEMGRWKGHLLVIKRQPDQHNQEFDKPMTMWDVFTSKSPCPIEGVTVHD